MYIESITLGAIMVFLLAMINGANDIGKLVGVLSGARIVNTRRAYLLNAIAMSTGAVLIGEYVSRTYAKGIVDFGSMIDPRRIIISLLSAVASTLLLALISVTYKIPVSISQLAVGGTLGSGLASCGYECVFWDRVFIITLSWITTPLIAMLLSIVLYRLSILIEHSRHSLSSKIGFIYVYTAMFTVQCLIYLRIFSSIIAVILATSLSLILTLVSYMIVLNIHRRVGIINGDWFYSYATTLTSFMLAFSYGAHDVGNAAGPLTVFLETINKETSNESLKSTIAITYSSIAFLLGALLWGYRIAETIGGRITPLTPATSFIVQLSTAFTVILLVGLNIPSSLTLALLGAIAGVGYARGLQYVNTRTLLEINMLWIIGVPLTILISYAFTSVSIRLL